MSVIARALVALLALMPLAVAHAQDRSKEFPSKTIRILVGASPGGTTDTLARLIGTPLSASLGKPVVVENRPGAGGNLAADMVAKAEPDGHTLLVSFTSHTINATLYKNLPFDPIADFTPISMIATVPSMLVSRPGLPAKTLQELIALARAKPDSLTIAIGGIGSSLHMAGEQFKTMADVSLRNVPYRGTAPALTDLLGGQVDLMFISMVTGMPQVKSGKLPAFGVTSPKRLQSLPDVPAIGEVVKGFESEAWFGVFGPGKLPEAIADKLNAAIVAALNDPKMQGHLRNEGATPAPRSAADFAAFVKEDVARWAPIVRRSGATID
jgi:tripartite-type tricarboxylate transporter receptor subunit TctC